MQNITSKHFEDDTFTDANLFVSLAWDGVCEQQSSVEKINQV